MKPKYIYFLIAVGLIACQKNKSKLAENLKAAQDTAKNIDSKKKTILNHRF